MYSNQSAFIQIVKPQIRDSSSNQTFVTLIPPLLAGESLGLKTSWEEEIVESDMEKDEWSGALVLVKEEVVAIDVIEGGGRSLQVGEEPGGVR